MKKYSEGMYIGGGITTTFFYGEVRVALNNATEMSTEQKGWIDSLITDFENKNGQMTKFNPSYEKFCDCFFGSVKAYEEIAQPALMKGRLNVHRVIAPLQEQTIAAIKRLIESFYGCNRDAVLVRNLAARYKDFGPNEIHPNAVFDAAATAEYQKIENFRSGVTHPWGGTWYYK